MPRTLTVAVLFAFALVAVAGPTVVAARGPGRSTGSIRDVAESVYNAPGGGSAVGIIVTVLLILFFVLPSMLDAAAKGQDKKDGIIWKAMFCSEPTQPMSEYCTKCAALFDKDGDKDGT